MDFLESFVYIYFLFFLNCDDSQDQLEKEIQKWGQKMNKIRFYSQNCTPTSYLLCLKRQ